MGRVLQMAKDWKQKETEVGCVKRAQGSKNPKLEITAAEAFKGIWANCIQSSHSCTMISPVSVQHLTPFLLISREFYLTW